MAKPIIRVFTTRAFSPDKTKYMMKIVRKADATLVILIVLVVIAVAIAFWMGGGQSIRLGLVQTGRLLETVWIRLLLGFTLGGLINVLVPRAAIARWLGPTSGIKGVLIGSYAGIIMSGAPYVMLPVVASLYVAGAGAGPIIALVTGQSLLGLQTFIAWQIPFLGVGLPLSKYITCLLITPLVGFSGAAVFKLLTRLPDLKIKDDNNNAHAGPKEGAGRR
ncbi:MAG: permease [Chloroflexota bacterium]